ncbi:MAG: DUF5119 domain-containing protein, partial [Muribaculaceae bacterium]|nr:DUF5119 domain-containing protein [Muribaculaceae bacterium]
MAHLRNSYKTLYIAATASLLLTTGCNHKLLDDLPEPDTRVRVVYDWRNAPEADPESMSVFFFNAESGNAEFDVFAGKEMEDGKYVNLEPGNWKMTTFNVMESGEYINSNDSHHVS